MIENLYSEIERCRVCGSNDLSEVLSLGHQALTGVFPKSEEENVQSGPVSLVACTSADGCGLVQLKQSYSTKLMYGDNYGYRSGLNASMVAHLNQKIAQIEERVNLTTGDYVIDIGSNDATSLHAYRTKGINRLGVDPSAAKFSSYYSNDMQLVVDFFEYDKIQHIMNGDKAKVITSFSMYYDLEDPVAFARSIKEALHEDGIWVLEQSYIGTMLSANSFDTVCHEHLEFYGLNQLDFIANKTGLKIIDVEFNNINGGSFSVTVAHQECSNYDPSPNVNLVLKKEKSLGYSEVKTFHEFHQRVYNAKNKLLNFLSDAKAQGKIVYGLGASTKGNVLLQYYGIDDTLLPKIAEVNADKFDCYTPGSKIPIISEEQALDEKPDYFLVLPWHFSEFFLENNKFSNINLVFPLPEFKIIQRSS